jgi:prohibitin 1
MSAAFDRVLTNLASVGFGAAAVGFFSSFCLFNVDGGERAVMWTMFGGVKEQTYGEGTHFMMPYFYRPLLYNVRLRPKLIQTTTGTKDIQTVTIHVRLLYRPEISKLPTIHKHLGPDYDERVLPSVGNEVLKSIVAQYNAEQLLTLRDKVSKEIRDAITARCAQFDIVLDDVSITHLAYGKEFSKAIEDKQVAQQEAERQKFVVMQADQERIATVIKAEGEAEAAQMISTALKEHGRGLVAVRKIDAARDIAETLSKSPNVTYLPGTQNMLVNLPTAIGGVLPSK